MYERLRILRKNHNLTQSKLAKILSCSQRVYSNYERGDLDIPTDILIKLADHYKVSIDFILDRTNNSKLHK